MSGQLNSLAIEIVKCFDSFENAHIAIGKANHDNIVVWRRSIRQEGLKPAI